jgi:hypothetical protein
MIVNLEEISFHNWPVLRYHVQIEILEIANWHVPFDSSLGDGSDTDDSHNPYHSGLSQMWPKHYKLVGDGGSVVAPPSLEDT